LLAQPTSRWNNNGLDGKPRSTALQFDPRPTRLAVNAPPSSRFGAATGKFAVRVGGLQQAGGAQAVAVLSWTAGAPPRDAPVDIGANQHRTSNNIFNEVLCQAMADLNMLMTETPQGRYPMQAFPGIRRRSAATA